MWVSVAMVHVKTSFLFLDGSDNADINNMCCSGVYSLFVRFL